MKIDSSFLSKKSAIIASIVIILGSIVVISDIYFYQRGFQAGYIKGKNTTLETLKNSTPQKSNQTSKKKFEPIMQKPKFYMGSIQGTLTYHHALKIAQSYFEKGAYENAIVWAYRANQINPKDIKSWKIYTQSLAKIGQEKEAQELMKNVEKFFKKSSKR